MKSTNRVSASTVDEHHVALIVDGVSTESCVGGRSIEAQYQVYDWLLVILELDLEYIHILLLDERGYLIDKEVVGHWYFDSLFENDRVLTDNTLEFNFGIRRSVSVHVTPRRMKLFSTKRHLELRGFKRSAL